MNEEEIEKLKESIKKEMNGKEENIKDSPQICNSKSIDKKIIVNWQSQILDSTALFEQKVDVYLLNIKIHGERRPPRKINFSPKSIRNKSQRNLVEAFVYITFKAREQHLRPEHMSFQLICAGVSEYLGSPKRTYHSIDRSISQAVDKKMYRQKVYDLAKSVYLLIQEIRQIRLDKGAIPVQSNPSNRKENGGGQND